MSEGTKFYLKLNEIDECLVTVREYLPKEELLATLAEEAAELSQAALKLRRSLNNINFTPVSVRKAESSLIEEIEDVNNCLRALGYEFVGLNGDKIKRWVSRLEDDGK